MPRNSTFNPQIARRSHREVRLQNRAMANTTFRSPKRNGSPAMSSNVVNEKKQTLKIADRMAINVASSSHLAELAVHNVP